MMFETAAFLWFSTVTITIVNNYSKIFKSIAFISVCAGVDRLNGLFTVITHAPGACQNLKTPIHRPSCRLLHKHYWLIVNLLYTESNTH